MRKSSLLLFDGNSFSILKTRPHRCYRISFFSLSHFSLPVCKCALSSIYFRCLTHEKFLSLTSHRSSRTRIDKKIIIILFFSYYTFDFLLSKLFLVNSLNSEDQVFHPQLHLIGIFITWKNS